MLRVSVGCVNNILYTREVRTSSNRKGLKLEHKVQIGYYFDHAPCQFNFNCVFFYAGEQTQYLS